ncbi:MAG: hypothetical protein WCF57_14180 [Pyrinomonadaceae bacterium]
MNSDVPGVMAAPNRSRIKAKVLNVEQSAKYPDKWHLELEILEASGMGGPNFARVGQKAEGFSFGPSWDAPPPAIIEADAEYIGGAQGGQFQLSNVRTVEE